MNADEINAFYKIDDPVYSGMINWRVETLRRWQRMYLSRSSQRVFEIGTGNYPFALALGGRNQEDVEYVGLEPDTQMSKSARMHVRDKFKHSTILQERWTEETSKKHPEWHGRFDVVCTFEVYEHVRAEEKFIHNARKLLTNDGYLILETPNTQITPLFVKVFNQNPDGGGDYQDADHVNEKSFHDLFLEIRTEGFEVIDFDCYYLPVSLWDDRSLEPFQQEKLYQHIHRAARMFPFYSYVQMFIARKKPDWLLYSLPNKAS